METEIDASPIMPENPRDFIQRSEPEPEPEPHHLPPPPQQYFYPEYINTPLPKQDFIGLDKVTYIIIFVAFILGFFMGKTMQPVILKSV